MSKSILKKDGQVKTVNDSNEELLEALQLAGWKLEEKRGPKPKTKKVEVAEE